MGVLQFRLEFDPSCLRLLQLSIELLYLPIILPTLHHVIVLVKLIKFVSFHVGLFLISFELHLQFLTLNVNLVGLVKLLLDLLIQIVCHKLKLILQHS